MPETCLVVNSGLLDHGDEYMVGLSRDFNSLGGDISKNSNSDTRSVWSVKLALLSQCPT